MHNLRAALDDLADLHGLATTEDSTGADQADTTDYTTDYTTDDSEGGRR